MGCVRVKNGASFDVIDPAGFRILGTLDRIAREVDYDLTISCGSNGHKASDPHTKGRAYDVRSKSLTEDQRQYVLRAVLLDLADGQDDHPIEASGGLITRRFFGWLEDPDTQNEHLHFQLRHLAEFP